LSTRALLAALAVLALIAGLACLGEAWRSAGGEPHLVPAASARLPAGHAGATTVPTGPVAAAPAGVAPRSEAPSTPPAASVAAPVSVEVPAVGLSADIVPVGLDGNGAMEIPTPTLAGWYRLGPAPGAVGPAVLVGHVDTRSGPAVFYRLTAIHVGDIIVVDRADRSRARFVVTGVTVVKKAVFPLDAVFGPTQGPSLRLITCTGPFDPASHHYVDSLIVWGVPAP
jgi:hypothetical protein